MEHFARLGAGERLAALGAAAMPVSMLFPWYGFKLGSPLSVTALDSFNFAHAALLLTAAAVIVLLATGDGRKVPRPLSVGGLLIAAGVWSLIVLAYVFADPPDELVDVATIGGVRIRYGAFVAAGAAAAMVVGGLRARHESPASTEATAEAASK